MLSTDHRQVPLPTDFDLAPIVADLSSVEGMVAIVLGGS
jgi:hypothetical protein